MSLKVGSYCFVPDTETVFKLVKVIERNESDQTLIVVAYQEAGGKSVNTTPIRVKEEVAVAVGSLEELESPPADLIKLQYVHRPGILHTLRSRFYKDHIYTSIGQILVALNPFKWIPGIYDQQMMARYKNREYNLSDQPHVFAISHDAFRDLSLGQNQSLIISGESGAGKTEATKQCLNYLAFIAGSSSGIQDRILKASPILEAWGNAKTLRNNNSSRFGKYIEIWFDHHYSIIGSSNTTYLLEKSRVVRQESGERNYHVFYQLLKGASYKQLLDFQLLSSPESKTPTIESFNLLNQSGCIHIDDVDDAKDYIDANNAFHDIGFTQDEQLSLYRIIAAILHMGNVAFVEGAGDESQVDENTTSHFNYCADLLCADGDEFKRALLFRKISSGGKRKSVVLAPYSPSAATDNRDALMKEIYRRCFDWIVSKINNLMYSDNFTATSMIGVLDIFGFEIFKKVSRMYEKFIVLLIISFLGILIL
jgi:myosin heavy subunit